MSKESASQSQQKFPVDPFGADWRKAMEEGAERLVSLWTGMHADLSKMERAFTEQATKSVDEGSRLMRESAEHGARLAAEWRALALEAGRRAMNTFTATHKN